MATWHHHVWIWVHFFFYETSHLNGNLRIVQLRIGEWELEREHNNRAREILFILILWVFCLHAYMRTTCVQCSQRLEEGIRSPRTRVTDVCAPLCGCWPTNPGHPEEQEVSVTTGSCLQTQSTFLAWDLGLSPRTKIPENGIVSQ